jgi:short-subunit dehydrogenase
VGGVTLYQCTRLTTRRTFRVNTLSHFITLRTFLPHMLAERRGTIVTVSSVLGHLGAANLSAYTASKAALLALHHSLRAELAQIPEAAEIKTILVTPGQMSTKMFADVKPPSNFFGPTATPAELGKNIIKLIERGDSGEVAIPLYSQYVGFFTILPVGIQQLVRRWSGLDKAVGKVFVGKIATSEKE